MKPEIRQLIEENLRRNKDIHRIFNPVTGEGSFLERTKVHMDDFPIKDMWLPKDMMKVPLVHQLIENNGISGFIQSLYDDEDNDEEISIDDREKVIRQFIRIRCKYDFPFWAYTFAKIKNKDGGDDIPFRLNRPQRKLIEKLEQMRTAGKPIRLILLKARQWGGSTATQIYMAWLQLIHITGWNSNIVAHVKDASAEVKGMFDKLIDAYPLWMLHDEGDAYNEKESKQVGVNGTQNINYIPQRNCKIKIGSAERPDSARGGDSALVHCTEVAFWKKTEGKTPQAIIRSACAGTSLKPLTLIVYESTANGTGNFFQEEYDAAKNGKSQFDSLFVAWFEIERYSLPVDDYEKLANWLWVNRNNANSPDNRSESGQYYWKLWKMGATFEAIAWYIIERKKYNDHADMAAEYPSDDVEAFKHSGAKVFDEYKVENFKRGCKAPKYIGDIYGDSISGKDALKDLRFSEDKQGLLWIWALPEIDDEEYVTNRYLVVVDIGGRSNKADWSVIAVYDRAWMMENGGKPIVVAQWYGHIDHDLLAWKAAQIAKFYDNALLVIESNTLETKDKERQVDGDQTSFILNQIKDVYDNLYARRRSEEEIREGIPVKYGFHTNVQTKPMIISMLVMVIREGLYVERDKRCLDEYLTYERKPNGAYGAIIGKHDDLLMTRAIGLYICYREMDTPRIIRRPRRTSSYKRKKPQTAATI